jgi:HEAT repeats
MPQPKPEDFRERVVASARTLVASWKKHEPVFSLRTLWSRSYDDIFGGELGTILREDEVLDHSLSTGRAILSGRGGDGKTWLLRRLFKRAIDAGIVPVFIDLKQWTGANYDGWKEWTQDNVGAGADFLVRSFSGLNVGIIDLDRLPPNVRKIIFVDGLNEITAKVGLEVLTVLDEIVAYYMNTSVIVVDRLVRRDLPSPGRWWIGTPLPLAVDEIRRHLPKDAAVFENDLRSSPFFLDAALRSGASGERRVIMLERMVHEHFGLRDTEVGVVADACFTAYSAARSRMFDVVAFREKVGQPILEKLEQSGAIKIDGTNGFFQHHIAHDFLAATHVARLDPSFWTPALFRDLSFDASSFDAVELAFELLAEMPADLFLQKLYDWNLYAAGYALAQRRQGDASVGAEMRTVILAMLADKRFDPVIATRQRAADALRLMQIKEAVPFRQATTLAELCALVDAVGSDVPWFNEWKEVFRISETQAIELATLAKIIEANSILGWTVANVAKRIADGAWILPQLAQWLDGSTNATVRWRIAHVLGAIPVQEALHHLRDLVDNDPDEDVRYGATRSLVELASIAGPELRAEASTAIAERASAISRSDRIARELRSSLLVDPSVAPPGWLSFVRGCVQALFLATERLGDRDLWRGCLNEAEKLYAPEPVVKEIAPHG